MNNSKGSKDMSYLSKSLFIRGLQCHKSLYLKKYRPELAEEPTDKVLAAMESGQEVGVLAQQLFPGGVLVPYEGLSYDEQLEQTDAAVKAGRIVYEGAFSYDGIFVKVDILVKGLDGWELYEVKGTTEVKPYHTNDLAAQYYVLKNAGIPMSKAFLVHINNQYVRHGDIEVEKLFTRVDLTALAEGKEGFVRDEIAKMREMLRGDEPVIDIGPQCKDPFGCDFHGHCWGHIPADSVFALGGKGINRFDYYRRGIVRMADLPLDELNRQQAMQVEALLTGNTYIDREAVFAFLGEIRYPLYFLDFETFWCAIPPYDGTRPYRPIPFQYSLHILGAEDGEPGHREYLAPQNCDPRKDLLLSLLKDVPGGACILMYTNYEAKILKCLAESFPEHAPEINDMIGRLVDLSRPFKAMHYYSRELEGSYSQKTVLPHLAPSLDYGDLEIQEGMAASAAFLGANGLTDPVEIERVRNALLRYCERDTLGMVMILEALRRMVGR